MKYGCHLANNYQRNVPLKFERTVFITCGIFKIIDMIIDKNSRIFLVRRKKIIVEILKNHIEMI